MANFGGFGTTRQSAESGGFFGWFMLEAVGREEPAPGQHVTHYRPNGPAFHALAELVITTDGSDQLLALELRLDREFIEHAHNGLFARDIAKSLLRGALDEANAVIFGDLANEIEFPRGGTVPVITARTDMAEPPDRPTPEYEVFLGRRARCEAKGKGMTLVTENMVQGGDAWWRLRISAS